MLETVPEMPAVIRFGQDIRIGVDAGRIHLIDVHQVVADFIAGIVEHDGYFSSAAGQPLEDHGKAVAAEDGRQYDKVAGQLGGRVTGDGVDRGIIALSTGDQGLRHADDIVVPDGECAALLGLEQRVGNDRNEIVTFSDNRRANAKGSCSD